MSAEAVHGQTVVKPQRRIRRSTVLILGVVVIPAVLGLALNSYGPLTVDSALRMAAAAVAGQTIAILSAIAAVILTIKRRQNLAVIIIIAVLIIGNALNTMGAAGESLISWLDLIAEVDRRHGQ
ncbi:hypothetical protein GC088_09955 [Arthrobacter sp. JZ12]|uniref:hypothetical protein n=1 Tax=Arthrobacter sp. JZ12 TaxID=2654190 RepID=UPI002B49C306|nr:hypothetical protein [Arthrobacter sp. JZ12]WRH25352.1 hypothetical protein GC088_09955 [Arthrobacter sp. JZ12]